MLITNTSRALQGVHSTNGLVFIESGQTRDIDVAKEYVERVKSLPYFAFGAKGAAAATAGPVEGEFVSAADLERYANEMSRLRSELASSTAKADELTATAAGKDAQIAARDEALTARDSQITSLKDRVAELELELEEIKRKMPAEHKLEATHRGRGSYSILDADGKELVEGLDKVKAEAFNAMDDAGKAKFIEENKKAA